MNQSDKNKNVITVQQRNEICNDFFSDCLSILQKKGADYNPGGNGFSTIEQSSDVMGVEVKKVIFGLMNKHFRSIMSFCRDGVSESEHIAGRLYDLANYCAILYAYLKSHEMLVDCPRSMNRNEFEFILSSLRKIEMDSEFDATVVPIEDLVRKLNNWWDGSLTENETFTQTEQE